MNFSVLARKVRGFRILDLAALFIVLALALSVYAFKASAGEQRADIADVESQIHDETRAVRLLQDEVHRLEGPGVLEPAARAAGQQPIDAKQEVSPDALAGLATQSPQPAASTSAASQPGSPATTPAAPAAAAQPDGAAQ